VLSLQNIKKSPRKKNYVEIAGKSDGNGLAKTFIDNLNQREQQTRNQNQNK